MTPKVVTPDWLTAALDEPWPHRFWLSQTGGAYIVLDTDQAYARRWLAAIGSTIANLYVEEFDADWHYQRFLATPPRGLSAPWPAHTTRTETTIRPATDAEVQALLHPLAEAVS